MNTPDTNRIAQPASTTLKDLQIIPGVGPRMAAKLIYLGIHSVADLADKLPDMLYQTLCELEGQEVDRCVLYVFRCAVYFAAHKQHDPDKLKWWYWKNHT